MARTTPLFERIELDATELQIYLQEERAGSARPPSMRLAVDPLTGVVLGFKIRRPK